MIVRRIVELVLLNVTGGEPAGDASIQKQEIRALLPAAINYVLVGQVWEDKKYQLEDMRFFGGGQDFSSEFTQVVQLSTTKDSVSGFYYASLPYGVLHLPGGKGFKAAYSTAMVPFVKASSVSQVHDIDSFVVWGYEGNGGAGRLWFKNLGKDCDVKIELIYNGDQLTWESEVKLPEAKLYEAISLLENWFRKQRHEVKDYLDESSDDRNEVSTQQRYPMYQGKY